MASSKTANYFSQIFAAGDDSDDESREKEEEEKRKLLHRNKKYLPGVKNEDELFDVNLHVNAGPQFMNNYGSHHDKNIVVICDNIKLNNIPYANDFRACNFTDQIYENIGKKRYMNLTQVQKAMIALIQKEKNDIIGRAQTGSGKTAAFLLPIIDEIHRDYINGIAQFNSDSPYAIITAPTRELVNQLYEEALSFAISTSIKIAFAHGDIPMGYSIKEVHKGCDILITTIGRLCHYTKDNIIRLHKVRYFIIDEADWFMQMQRSQTTIEDIQYIKSELRHKYRTIMMSATFDEQAELMAKQFLQGNYFFVSIPETISTISHIFLKVEKYDKKNMLVKLIEEKSTRNEHDGLYNTEKTIIFKNGRRECDRLGVALCYYGFRAITIHKNRTQQQRQDAIEKFTKGFYHIIVSTDIIGRGINFPNVEHVINFDLPKAENYNQYIHRVGRTGRTGNFGRATSFFDPTSIYDCDIAHFYAKILEDLNQPVPHFLIPIIASQREYKEQNEQERNQLKEASLNGNKVNKESEEMMDVDNIFTF